MVVIHLPKKRASTSITLKKNRHYQKLYALLSQADPDISKIDNKGWTPMHRAIEIDNIEIVRILILKCNGANLNFTNQNGSTPLTFAIALGNFKIIDFLLKNGADVNKVDSLEWTSIEKVVHKGNMEILKTLLQNGANLNIMTDGCFSPLSK